MILQHLVKLWDRHQWIYISFYVQECNGIMALIEDVVGVIFA